MSIVAVAGGTGGVGKTIVERLAEESRYLVIVLTRSEPKKNAQETAHHLQVNYDDIPSLKEELERFHVHTVVSAIGLVSEETSQAQLNLIEAAEQSKTTERFIPSEFSFIQTPDLLPIDPSIQWWLDAVDRLKSTSLKYTRVVPGFFMDYWGMPFARTNLQPYTFGISIPDGKAVIPGDGNDVICMTHTQDMANCLVRILDLDEWPEISVIVGDEVTYNQLLETAEEIRGQKFDVVYDSVEKVNAGNVTVPPIPAGTDYPPEEVQEITALVDRLVINGVFDLPRENRLNHEFYDVRARTMREFLEYTWNKKSDRW